MSPTYDAVMSSNTKAQQPGGAGHPPGPVAYDTRLATRIPRAVDQRLRLFAVLVRKPLAHVLADVLAEALPTDAELAARLGQRGSGADETA
jgi:hypothetical protein